jgi:hypothetical protein
MRGKKEEIGTDMDGAVVGCFCLLSFIFLREAVGTGK